MTYTPNTILLHMKEWLPQFTDLFTEQESINAEIVSGTPQILRVTKNAHGYSAGKAVNFKNVLIDNGIVNVSLNSGVLRFTTNVPHDLTGNFSTVVLRNFTDSQFNGSFEVYSIPSATTFEIVNSTLPVLNGNEVLREDWSIGLNETFLIESVTANTFDILLTGKPVYDTLPLPSIDIVTSYRMGIVDNITRMNEVYTKQLGNKYWAFLIMGDSIASKDRNLVSDLQRADTKQTAQRVMMGGTFSIIVIIPTASDLTAAQASQKAYDEILEAMYKAMVGVDFVDGTEFLTNLVSHGSVQYNKAYYGHGYDFEAPYEIDYTDTFRVFGSKSRAWRKTELSFNEIQDGSFIDMEG